MSLKRITNEGSGGCIVGSMSRIRRMTIDIIPRRGIENPRITRTACEITNHLLQDHPVMPSTGVVEAFGCLMS
jgi:hypothetical protein